MKTECLNMISDKKNNFIKFIIGIIISIGLIYYSLKDFNFSKFSELAYSINYSLIIFSSLILIFTVYLRALRWKILMNDRGKVNFLYKSELIGYFINNIFPLRLGEFVRAHIVGEKYSVSKPKVFGSIVLERFLDMAAVSFLLVILLFKGSFFLNLINQYLFYSLLAVLIITVFGILFSYSKNSTLKTKNKYLIIILDLYNGFINLRKDNLLFIFLYTFLIWSFYLFQLYLVQTAFNLNLSIEQTSILLIISSVAISIPALPGNFGTFEGSVVYSLSLFNIIDDFGFGFILHAVSFIPYTLLGLVYFIENLDIIKKNNLHLSDV